MLSTVLSTAALLLSLIAFVFALICVRATRRAAEYVAVSNKRSVTLRQLSDIQAELTDQADAVAALHENHKKLRSRIGMRHLREQRKDDVPDPTADPQGFKHEMRKRLLLEKANGK